MITIMLCKYTSYGNSSRLILNNGYFIIFNLGAIIKKKSIDNIILMLQFNDR